MEQIKKSNSLSSVAMAVDILKCLADGHTRLTAIARTLKISKSTAHRLLKTLERSGMVSQEPVSRTYRLGHLFLKLAAPMLFSHQGLINYAHPDMYYLRNLSGETVLLYVLNGREVVCIEQLTSLQPIKYTVGIGATIPLNVGSSTKVILAQLTDDEVRKMLEKTVFSVYTSQTETNHSGIIEQVQKARERGYATSISTYDPGSAAVSVPVNNYVVPAALCILGSEQRFSERIPEIIPALKECAGRISLKLINGAL